MKKNVINDRYSLIKKYVLNKKVLDLGSVDHSASTENKSLWLHKFIQNYAKQLVGVDMETKEVEILNKKGYNILVDNVETMRLGKKFEVIVAGELIEHVRNVGLFLDSVRLHMDKDSRFILTTPNTFAIRRFFRNIVFGTNPNNHNHTYYFDVRTLKQNFEYANLGIVEWYYFFDSNKPFYKYWIEKFFVFLRPVFAPNMIFILKKK